MKKLDLDVDAMIREALSQEDAEIWEALAGGPTVHETVAAVFRGRNRWLTYLAVFATLAFMALGIYCLVRYMGAEDVSQKLDWGGGFLLCLFAVMANKLWYWMEMQRTALSREIKRLELQVAHLASGLLPGKREG
jgi:hypothetical protein